MEPSPSGRAAEPPVASSGAAAASAAPSDKDEPPPSNGRMIVSEARLSLKCARPENDADAIGRYVADIGGYIVSREAERNDDIVMNVEVTMRVPSAKFESAVAELRRHGTVLAESTSGKDVTAEFTDNEAQLKSKRRLEERLLHIVDGATAVKDMLDVENELTRVRTDIERLEGHSRLLANQASFATIFVTLTSPLQPLAVDRESIASQFSNSFRTAGSIFIHVTTGIIVALVALLPVALPGGAVFLFWRRRRRLLPAGVDD